MDFLCDEPDDQPAKKAGGSKPKAVKPVLKPCLKKAPAQENTQKKLPAAKKKPAAAAQKKPAVVQKISSSELLKTNAFEAPFPKGQPTARGSSSEGADLRRSPEAWFGLRRPRDRFFGPANASGSNTTLNLIWLSFDPFDCFSLIAHLILFDPF